MFSVALSAPHPDGEDDDVERVPLRTAVGGGGSTGSLRPGGPGAVAVSLRHLRMRYPNGVVAVHDLDLEVRAALLCAA